MLIEVIKFVVTDKVELHMIESIKDRLEWPATKFNAVEIDEPTNRNLVIDRLLER